MQKRINRSLTLSATLIALAACGEPAGPNPETAGVPRLDALIAQTTSMAARSGKHILRNGEDEYVIDHLTGTLRGKAGKVLRIPKEDLAKLEESFDQMGALDLFFSALNNDKNYQNCVEAGKKSNHLTRAAAAQLAASPVGQAPFRPAKFVFAQPVTTRGANVVDIPVMVSGSEGNCGDWANALIALYHDYNQTRTDYFAILAGGVGAGISVSAGSEVGIAVDAAGPAIAAGYVFTQLLDLWTRLSELQLTINLTESIMGGLGCIAQLPPVIIGPGGGGGEDCSAYIITIWQSDDGGTSWYVAAQWEFDPPC
jgi:hypothetical protein